MLRGFRWQLVALLTAAGLFVISLLVRMGDTPTPTVTPPPGATAAADATSTPAAVPVSFTQLQPSGPATDVATYREGLVGSVQRLNPVFAPLNPVDRDITSLIFEGLTRTNTYGEPEPALARDWIISSDGLEYIIRLRQDVLWQDGVPFNADDVVYTMSILRSPDFTGPQDLGAFWRTVETQKLDDYTVRFRLTQRLASFLDMLRMGILPVHALAGTSAAQLAQHPFNLSPIGTGPYQLEALRSPDGQHITAVDLRVAPVFRQRPEGQNGYALERVRFQLYGTFNDARNALAQGQLDGLATSMRAQRLSVLALTNVNPHTQILPDLGVLIFNWANDDTAFFREQRMRVALEVGLDRSSIVERTLPNQAVRADSPIMPGSWAYLSGLPWPGYDPTNARQLLETARERVESEQQAAAAEATAEATDDATGGMFRFEILTPDDPALQSMANEIATQWSQYGLGVTVASADHDTYEARLDSGDFDAALVELSLGDSADPDVYQFWHQGQYPDGKNYGGVNDRRISESLERARQDTSGINRVEFYRQFQQDFVDRAIAIPMYYPLFTYATSLDVQGLQLGFMGTPADRFRNIGDWSIQ